MPALGETRHGLDSPAAAFELDRMHPGLQILDRTVDGVPARALIRAEGKVADEQLVRGAASHRASVVQHLGHGHGQGVRVAEDVVAERVADEQHRHLGLREQLRGRVVVRGEHDEPLAFGLPCREVVDGDRHGYATCVAELGAADSPAVASVATSASMARVMCR